jgi:predicted CDP-diglyceride synthetase/phosphatidate cytidylyltransferase
MAEPSPDRIVIGAIGPLITTVIGAVVGWLPGGLTGATGSPLRVLLAALGGISGLVFSALLRPLRQ